ncbi:MAG: hypothetical protein ACPG4T_07120 [Nannocystaceae bacterium]
MGPRTLAFTAAAGVAACCALACGDVKDRRPSKQHTTSRAKLFGAPELVPTREGEAIRRELATSAEIRETLEGVLAREIEHVQVRLPKRGGPPGHVTVVLKGAGQADEAGQVGQGAAGPSGEAGVAGPSVGQAAGPSDEAGQVGQSGQAGPSGGAGQVGQAAGPSDEAGQEGQSGQAGPSGGALQAGQTAGLSAFEIAQTRAIVAGIVPVSGWTDAQTKVVLAQSMEVQTQSPSPKDTPRDVLLALTLIGFGASLGIVVDRSRRRPRPS